MNYLRKNCREIAFLLLLLLGTLVFVLFFEKNKIENNTPEALRSMAFFLPGVGLLTAGFLYEIFRKKKNAQKLSAFFLLSIGIYLLSLLLMVLFAV